MNRNGKTTHTQKRRWEPSCIQRSGGVCAPFAVEEKCEACRVAVARWSHSQRGSIPSGARGTNAPARFSNVGFPWNSFSGTDGCCVQVNARCSVAVALCSPICFAKSKGLLFGTHQCARHGPIVREIPTEIIKTWPSKSPRNEIQRCPTFLSKRIRKNHRQRRRENHSRRWVLHVPRICARFGSLRAQTLSVHSGIWTLLR